MKKFALIAEFVLLSEQLFSSGRPTIDIDLIWSERQSMMKGGVRLEDLRNIGRFGSSLHNLVPDLGQTCRWPAEYECNLQRLHDRLVGITKEILAPL
jgi:hypothetical protein